MQGIMTLVVAFLWIIAGFVLALAVFVKVLLMIGLFVAPPFGTIAYLVVWGWFPDGQAAALLAVLLFLKLVLAGLPVAAQQRFPRVKDLMILLPLSVILQVVLGLIHGILPRMVVSSGDELWAVVTAIVALIWVVIMVIIAIPAIINAIRVTDSPGGGLRMIGVETITVIGSSRAIGGARRRSLPELVGQLPGDHSDPRENECGQPILSLLADPTYDVNRLGGHSHGEGDLGVFLHLGVSRNRDDVPVTSGAATRGCSPAGQAGQVRRTVPHR